MLQMSALMTEQDNQLQILRDAQDLKIKNLEFFKVFHPAIYKVFNKYALKDYKVSLNTDIGQLDILHNGKSIYNQRPMAEANEMLSTFEENFAPGNLLKTIDPPFNTYGGPRFFHKHCNEITISSPIGKCGYFGYTIPDFYPLMIFNGIGAGYHIETFLKKHAVINCIIVEPEPDLFATSLYTIDWEDICQPFIDHKERNIHFTIGPFENEEHISAALMSYLSQHCPLYPLTTLYINHKNREEFTKVTDKLNKDTNAFVSIWGYYDDEINQLNNCLHNLHLKIPLIKPNAHTLLDLPIFIIGAGPSLDEKIEMIKKYQGRALIVSCGTAIHCLYSHGIKPDIQFELESDQCTVTSLEELNDPEWIRSIPMMGPSQLAPKLYKLADEVVIFFKGESVTSMLFGNENTSVSRATPTCTNGALGVFAHWGFKSIYMFGIDFGYRDTDNHHAKGSIYYTSTDKAFMADADVDDDAKVIITAVDGSKMRTKPLLYTAMRSTETLAGRYKEYCTFYNCSNGAAMQHTTWIEEDILPLVETLPLDDSDRSMKAKFIKLQYKKNKNTIKVAEITSKLESLEHNMKELNNYIIEQISLMTHDLYSFSTKINDISTFMDKVLKPKVPAFYFYMRGSIWHLLYIGYSHALAIKKEDKKDLEQWIASWKEKTISMLTKMPVHYNSVVFKDFDYDSDPWMHRSASDPE